MPKDSELTTRGGYEIVAGPIERPLGCKAYVVLNDDGHFDQLHVCKCFPNGRISKRGTSQYDLMLPDVDSLMVSTSDEPT